jgi:hypothetical protein
VRGRAPPPPRKEGNVIWIVRQYWEGIAGGSDEELEDAERVEADDPEEAARAFMEQVEETGNLHEWIGDQQRCDLLVRGETDTTDHLVEITVDWSPNIYAAEKPSPAEVDPSVPSCSWCKHPQSKHGAGLNNDGCGVLHCNCSTTSFEKAAP